MHNIVEQCTVYVITPPTPRTVQGTYQQLICLFLIESSFSTTNETLTIYNGRTWVEKQAVRELKQNARDRLKTRFSTLKKTNGSLVCCHPLF